MQQLSRPALDDSLAAVTDRFLVRLAQVGADGAETLFAEFPAHAEELRRLLPAMLTLVALGESAGESPTSSSLSGQPLGDFQLLRELGRGGMGVVYEAEQLSLGRHVAVKILPLAAVLDERQLQRFKHEAAAAAMLKHPHIVSVYSVGNERGVYYYAMELVEGQTLAQVVEARKRSKEPGASIQEAHVEARNPNDEARTEAFSPSHLLNSSPSQPPPFIIHHSSFVIPPDTARALYDTTARPADFFVSLAQLGIQAAEALEEAHSHGIVHRDIKPSNLMVDARGHLWVTDFGLAQIESAPELTLTGDLLGTLRYMSPEQLDGTKVVDERTDIYSLGLSLYELLTGRPAFTAAAREKLIQQVLLEEPPPPRRLDSRIPGDLETIILKSICKEREGRYQSAAELAQDLRRFIDARPIHARRASSLQRLRYWARRKPAVAALAAIVVVALALGVAGTSYGWLTAARRAEEYRELLYRADMATALEASRTGDYGKLRTLLGRHVPTSGQQDLRGFEWYYLWRTVQESGAERVFPHDQPVVQLTFLDDRQVAARMLRGEIRIHDIEQGTSRRPTAAEFATVLPPFFHGGHNNWAYGIRLGDTAEAIERNRVAAAMHDVISRLLLWSPIVSPAGDLLAGGAYQNEARLVDVTTEKVRATLKGHEGILLDMAFSPNGAELATAGRDGRVMLWNTADGSRNATIAAHSDTCGCVAYSPDGRWLITCGRDECIRIWDARSHAELHRLDVLGDTNHVVFSLDGSLMAAAGNANVIYLWRVDGWKLLKTLKGHSGSTNVLCFSPDGQRLASGAGDGDVRIWRLDQPSEDVPWFTVRGEARSLAFHPKRNVLASGSWGGSVQLWDVQRRASLAELERRGERVLTVAFDAEGTFLAAAGDEGIIRVFDVADRRLLAELRCKEASCDSFFFAPTGDIAACGQNGVVYIWRRAHYVGASGVVAPDIRLADAAYPTALAISRDGRRMMLANTAGTGFELRSFPAGPTLARGTENSQFVMAAASSPREDLFATGAIDGVIHVWEDHTLACRHVLRGHSNYVIGLAFSPSEDILASASLDGTVRLWDTLTGAERASFAGHNIGASSVSFSHRGDMLATGDLKGNIRLFVAASAADVTRELTRSSTSSGDSSALSRKLSARGP